MEKRIVKAKVRELEIPAEEPFKNDKPERKSYAEILTDIEGRIRRIYFMIL